MECNTAMAPIVKTVEGVWVTLPDRKETNKVHNLEMIKLERSVEFEPLNEIFRGGLYTTEEIEEARRNLLFPTKRNRVIT